MIFRPGRCPASGQEVTRTRHPWGLAIRRRRVRPVAQRKIGSSRDFGAERGRQAQAHHRADRSILLLRNLAADGVATRIDSRQVVLTIPYQTEEARIGLSCLRTHLGAILKMSSQDTLVAARQVEAEAEAEGELAVCPAALEHIDLDQTYAKGPWPGYRGVSYTLFHISWACDWEREHRIKLRYPVNKHTGARRLEE